MKHQLVLLVFLQLYCIPSMAQYIGIGTSNPQARLHVTDSSVIFSASGGAVASPRNPPNTGPGRKMLWYADRAAFRSGFAATAYWDRDSTGNYSLAVGNNPLALGDNSVSIGSFTQARGTGSIAVGGNSIAYKDYTIAIGDRAEAGGIWSVSLGMLNKANGNNSFATGRSALATGVSSMALGQDVKASEFCSVAMGYQTKADIPYSFVAGQYNDTADVPNAGKIFQIGNGNADNNRSNAITVLSDGRTGIAISSPIVLLHQDQGDGLATYHKFTSGNSTGQTLFDGFDIGINAGGEAEIKQRENTHISFFTNNISRVRIDSAGNVGIGDITPSARLQVTEGSVVFNTSGTIPGTPDDVPVTGAGRRMLWYADKAAFRAGYVSGTNWDAANTGNYSFAMGNNTLATGFASLAAGENSSATGVSAVALGNNTTASGNYSMAAGEESSANATAAAAFGENVKANGYASLVAGRFNDSIVSKQTLIASNTPLFIVGNGVSDVSRSNALVVRNDANTGINNSNPRTNLDVNGDVAIRQNSIALVNGANNNIDPGKFSFVTVSGPTAAFSISGVQNGRDGKIVTILNTTGQDMTIGNLSVSSAALNRINTLSGADIITVGNGSVTMQYSAADSRWMVIALRE
ncbi:MAG: hypothetical protein JNK14_13865 [Chitinophagaceae bacterium]|nr:hypothetical protein [Chitinophagaceae bacterium]